jgi:outer membrane protein OmpA-like peptidoglycan-associated protein
MKMKHCILAGLALILFVPAIAVAQEVSEQRIVSGLGKLQGAAPIVDIELLRQEAMTASGKPMSGLPNWSKVSHLPQMVVEINFANDSVAIEPESYRTLGMIADALHHPNLWAYKFLVVGHTSSTGSDQHNLELSQKRSDAIKEILSTTFAVDPGRLYAVGVGEYFPIEGTKSESADNRRVQLYNLGVFTKRQ